MNNFLWNLLMILLDTALVGVLASLFIYSCSKFYKPKKKYIYRIIYVIYNFEIVKKKEFICVAKNEQQLLKKYNKFLSENFSLPIHIVSIEILGEDGFLYKKEVDDDE